MGNKQHEVQMCIQLDKQFYFAGDTVNGIIHMMANKPYPCGQIVLQITGIQSNQFRGGEGRVQNHQVQNVLIKYKQIITRFGPNRHISGQYSYPFAFRLLPFLPGSYNEISKKGFVADIQYSLKAIIQPFEKKPAIQCQQFFAIRQPQKQGGRPLYGQTFIQVKPCCSEKGISRVACQFQKNYYFPGDECSIFCAIDNIKCPRAITSVTCRFIKQITLTSRMGFTKIFSQELNRIQFQGVAAHHARGQQNAQRRWIKLCSKQSEQPIPPSTNGRFVRCHYYLLVQPIFQGSMNQIINSQFRVSVTILQPAIVQVPPEIPQGWNPKISERSQIYLQNNGANEQKNDLIGSMDNQSYHQFNPYA